MFASERLFNASRHAPDFITRQKGLVGIVIDESKARCDRQSGLEFCQRCQRNGKKSQILGRRLPGVTFCDVGRD